MGNFCKKNNTNEIKKPRIIYVDLLTDDEPMIQPEDFCGNAIKTTNYTM